MSEATPETLHAEFLAAHEAYLGIEVTIHGIDCAYPYRTAVASYTKTIAEFHPDVADWTADDWSDHGGFGGFSEHVFTAACRYVVARDFGIFDPQQAGMLWKLQHGGDE